MASLGIWVPIFILTRGRCSERHLSAPLGFHPIPFHSGAGQERGELGDLAGALQCPKLKQWLPARRFGRDFLEVSEAIVGNQ